MRLIDMFSVALISSELSSCLRREFDRHVHDRNASGNRLHKHVARSFPLLPKGSPPEYGIGFHQFQNMQPLLFDPVCICASTAGRIPVANSASEKAVRTANDTSRSTVLFTFRGNPTTWYGPASRLVLGSYRLLKLVCDGAFDL